VRHGGKRPRPKRSQLVGRPNELGGLLADLRTARGLSLREVEEAADNAVSNAYLSQLENGKIQKPSPNVLHSLAQVYAVPYEALMEKAGYLLPCKNEGRRAGPRRASLAPSASSNAPNIQSALSSWHRRHRLGENAVNSVRSRSIRETNL
jgi:transcriptional regulator with XRE-family HTH domain